MHFKNPLQPKQWLEDHPDRDIIRQWTVPDTYDGYRLAMPPVAQPLVFLALGDTGDSEGFAMGQSPQDAVAAELAACAALPGSQGTAQWVVHTGDVVYMTGEHRLYDRCFCAPYAPFLTPNSTSDNITFRLPFLPVPGNHDYYDLGAWARWISRTPFLSSGLRFLSRELLEFHVPRGGSGMGKTYMDAFVQQQAPSEAGPLPYVLETATRIPNRYYQYSIGSIDFFALDSNTLDAPAQSETAVHTAARAHLKDLEIRREAITAAIAEEEQTLNYWRTGYLSGLVQDERLLQHVTDAGKALSAALAQLDAAVHTPDSVDPAVAATLAESSQAAWNRDLERLQQSVGQDATHVTTALTHCIASGDTVCEALSNATRTTTSPALAGAQAALEGWERAANPVPDHLRSRLETLGVAALDIQRTMALEQRRANYKPEDFDIAQLDWLRKALDDSEARNPDGWRVVVLHHPLYTSIGNHCEEPDVVSIRDNVAPVLGNRVDMILSGHAHAFEWFHSNAMPHTGVFVTGGGGQKTLRKSILDPARVQQHAGQYEALRQAQVLECAAASDGPAAFDGVAGPIFHFLQISLVDNALVVEPVGIRATDGGYRREKPMPVYHASQLPPASPPWKPRLLHSITIRKGRSPEAQWSDNAAEPPH